MDSKTASAVREAIREVIDSEIEAALRTKTAPASAQLPDAERQSTASGKRVDWMFASTAFAALALILGFIYWQNTGLREDMRANYASLRAEIGSVRAEIRSIREETNTKIEGFRSDMREDIGSVREEIGALRGEIGSIREEIGTLRGEVSLLGERIARVETIVLDGAPAPR